MHIPDGFLAPEFYLPAWGAAALAVAQAVRKVKAELNERTLPRLGVFTAAAFLLMSIALPLPFGGTIHATGIPLLAFLFGRSMALASITIVLLLQSLLLGEGGATALGMNILIMGVLGPSVVRSVYAMLRRNALGVGIATGTGVIAMALATAAALSLQPLIGSDAEGRPLFFPLHYNVVFPAVIIPHIWLAVIESLVTAWVVRTMNGAFPGLPERQIEAERSR